MDESKMSALKEHQSKMRAFEEPARAKSDENKNNNESELINDRLESSKKIIQELTAQVHAKSEECAYYKRLIKKLTTFQI